MIDGGKLNAAISILSKLPSECITTIREMEPDHMVFSAEYNNHEVVFQIEHDAVTDPIPYVHLIGSYPDLFRYFIDTSVQLDRDKEELLIAFQITFNALMRENSELKSKLGEKESETEGNK